MENLASKLLAFIDTEKSIEFTKEELEIFLKMVELSTQIDVLENLPDDKRLAIEEAEQELSELLKGNHFEGLSRAFWGNSTSFE